MSIGIARNPLLRVAAVTAGLTSGTAIGAEWTLTPAGQIFVLTQQNPRLATDEKDTSTAIGAQAAVQMQRRTERLALTIRPSAGLHRYQRDEDLDRSEQHLDMTLGWRGERIGWLGSANAARDTTLTSELGSTGLTQSNRRHETYSVSLGPEWQASERLQMGSRLGLQAHSYPGLADLSLVGYRYSTASVYFGYALSDRAGLSLSTAAGRLNSDGPGAHSDNASVNLQARYAWSPLWMLSVAAGPSWVRAGQGREQGLVYSADVRRSFENSSLSLDVSRSQSPSGRGVLSQLDEARLSFTTQITERLNGAVSASVVRRSDAFSALGLELEDVRYSRADVSMAWRVTENWQLSAAVGHAIQRVGSAFRDDVTGRGFDARLTLSWSADPHVN